MPYKSQKYCSRRCGKAFIARRQRLTKSKAIYVENCLKCQVKIEKPRRKFCSKACKDLYNNRVLYKIRFTKQWRGRNPKNFLSSILTKNQRISHGLTLEILLKLYEKQNGLCAITKIPMTHELFHGRVNTNISVDRIDSDRGYSEDNIQLVCVIVNIMKFNSSMEELRKWCFAILTGKYK